MLESNYFSLVTITCDLSVMCVTQVDPLDGGSDNGFTFTSPNWPTVPQKSISRITAQTPNHPANSFYYPDRLSHPPIATFQLVKVSI